MALVMSKRRRISLVSAGAWLSVVFVFALNAADGYSFDFIALITGFVVFGVLPVFLCFGIAWIKRSEFSESSCPDCGSNLRFYVPTAGDHAGRPFLVCNRHPDCKKVLAIDLKKAAAFEK